jgi:hypothetical protein
MLMLLLAWMAPDVKFKNVLKRMIFIGSVEVRWTWIRSAEHMPHPKPSVTSDPRRGNAANLSVREADAGHAYTIVLIERV